eukprot:7154980-Pyramimonas_sp.AAC.1
MLGGPSPRWQTRMPLFRGRARALGARLSLASTAGAFWRPITDTTARWRAGGAAPAVLGTVGPRR